MRDFANLWFASYNNLFSLDHIFHIKPKSGDRALNLTLLAGSSEKEWAYIDRIAAEQIVGCELMKISPTGNILLEKFSNPKAFSQIPSRL